NEQDPPSERTYRRCTFVCDHQGTYEPKKTVILENQRNSKSKRSGCRWHVNVSFSKKTAVISITSLELSHNYTISPRANLYAPKYRTFPNDIVQEVHF
ncbi:10691_t:CDS:1, partial [Dentiscutata erythropus]